MLGSISASSNWTVPSGNLCISFVAPLWEKKVIRLCNSHCSTTNTMYNMTTVLYQRSDRKHCLLRNNLVCQHSLTYLRVWTQHRVSVGKWKNESVLYFPTASTAPSVKFAQSAQRSKDDSVSVKREESDAFVWVHERRRGAFFKGGHGDGGRKTFILSASLFPSSISLIFSLRGWRI